MYIPNGFRNLKVCLQSFFGNEANSNKPLNNLEKSLFGSPKVGTKSCVWTSHFPDGKEKRNSSHQIKSIYQFQF